MRSPFFQAATLLGLFPMAACAQMHHVDAPDRVTRAVGVYEWVGELGKPAAARLVPVTLFINGRTEDAGTYLARPVPMALETGNLYAVEFAGLPKGTLDVMMARDVASQKSAADDNPVGNWYGYGLFELPKPAKASTLKPSVTVAQLTATAEDDRPHFVAARPQAEETPADRRAAAGKDDDPEKPTLGRRDPDAQPEKEKKKKSKAGGYVTGLPNGLNDDPDRPTLGRNKTAQAQTPPLTGLPPDMKQAVAVSDAVSAENHEFAREWENADEHAQALTGIQAIATAAVKEYLAANGLTPATPGAATLTPVQPARSTAVRPGMTSHRTPAKTLKQAEAPIVLGDEQLKGLQLSYGGLPTFVYSAETMAASKVAGTGPMQVKIYATVVAQRLPSGELQTSLKSVTDDAHLSRVPWMRFVDAVDPDGSHRASLLYELRGKSSRQFALYRLVTAQAEQTFATALLE